MNEFNKAKLVKLIQDLAIIHAAPDEEFTLANGTKSKYYLDCRKVTLDREGLMYTLLGMCEELDGVQFDTVGGLTMGADPIVAGLIAGHNGLFLETKKPDGIWDKVIVPRGFIVRKEPKVHGMGNLIEGHLRAGDKAVVVEDVATSGGSIMKAVRAVEAKGATVVKIVTLLDRLQGAAETLAGYDFKALVTTADLGL